ncbi:OLC1v1020113C1 [Oldenlandia corymbosa var. corymbosa]|uniref:OLC1v1020113C1 n=1 Tax=Oldenlandia corymbosa var. corymbosa TaxID=529605 RepID=A0AAV1EFQ9_OLDCO|nr:OLC1v1020113C1 [Oldenlandia corymbosa var. corymbosa]
MAATAATAASAAALGALLSSAVSSSTQSSLRLGRAIHAKVIRTQRKISPFLVNHLINMYSKLNQLDSAEILLLRLTPSASRSVVTWTSLISGCVQNGHLIAALRHFSDMRRRDNVLPNDFTFPCLFKAAASLNAAFLGRQLHGSAVKLNFDGDVYVASSALDMYFKTDLHKDAYDLFDQMPHRNIATWNALICNAVLNGHVYEAVGRFVELLRGGRSGEGDPLRPIVVPDSVTFCALLNACADCLNLKLGQQLHSFMIRYGYDGEVAVSIGLIDFYGKCKEVKLAKMIFDGINEKNSVSWGSMVAVYKQNDMEEKAWELFHGVMKGNVGVTDFLISSVLSACAGLAVIEFGRMAHGVAMKAAFVEKNVVVGSALVDMYAKCGSIEDCERAFYDMKERNLFVWNALIGGYAHQGYADTALLLFERMMTGVNKKKENVMNMLMPNHVTLVCVLTACSRGGKVDVGMDIFESMNKGKYGFEPGVEHYACVVDMLGRAGLVDRAYEFIKNMPICPTISIWGALLGACKVYKRPDLGRIAAESLFELDPADFGNHILLSNTLAAAERWEEATCARKALMKGIGHNKKGTGYSWIYAKNSIHVFRAKDTSHECYHEIHAILDKLRRDMKAAGYVPNTEVALYDLEAEEKESEIGYHSEKIALAFGLITLPPQLPIRINKNLRVCVDCHSAMKFISGIIGREIIVRDNSQFHRFKDNNCSCGDYW